MNKTLAVLLLAPMAALADPLTLEDLSGKRAFQTMDFEKFVDRKIAGSYPLEVTIPRIYRARDLGHDVSQTIWVTREDYRLIRDGGTHSGDYGYFIAKITMNVGYDQAADEFFSADARGIEGMVAMAAAQGFEHVSVSRIDHEGVPMLEVTGRLESGVTSNIVYVATRIETNVVFIYYRRADDWSEADALIWKTFVDSLAGRNEEA